MSHRDIAEQLESGLHLDVPVVALAFVERTPAGVQQFEGEVPAACSFWRQAETDVFYAPAAKHFNCPIGAMTMGFEMPEDAQQRLMGLVTMMCENGYIAADEPAKIPTNGKPAAGIVYGPLAALPVEPDLVLLWLTPRQAMLYSEAVGSAAWTTTSPATIWGRPACAALPGALTNQQSTLSFGCTGMRTFTGVREDRLLAVLPGNQAGEFAGSLGAVLESNEKMRAYYEEHKASFVP
jgi:uncharacterized protein (DUF169 family)